MPRLDTFLFCESVIFDTESQSTSLINVFDSIEFVAGPGIQALQEAGKILFPKSWYVFTNWIHENDDEGKKFVQRIVYVTPDDDRAVVLKTEFSIPQRQHRMRVLFPILPLTVPGEYKVECWLDGPGEASELQSTRSLLVYWKQNEEQSPQA